MANEPYEWIIEYKGKCSGFCRLGVHSSHHKATFAIGLFDAELRGIGVGSEAVQLALSYAFEYLSLHRVSLKVFAFNERALHVYKKCGFVVEGIERDAVFFDGRYESDVLMSILRHEFDDIRGRFVPLRFMS